MGMDEKPKRKLALKKSRYSNQKFSEQSVYKSASTNHLTRASVSNQKKRSLAYSSDEKSDAFLKKESALRQYKSKNAFSSPAKNQEKFVNTQTNTIKKFNNQIDTTNHHTSTQKHTRKSSNEPIHNKTASPKQRFKTKPLQSDRPGLEHRHLPKRDDTHYIERTAKPISVGKNIKKPKTTSLQSQQKLDNQEISSLIRLNRYIANSGVCSRRDADNLIKAGHISVNGQVVTDLGVKVKPSDKVTYKGKLLSRERKVYILLNKPKGYITTVSDPQERKTVMDLVKNACEERIFPVGRLDRNTSGLLLLTNDGELSAKLSHPSGLVKKIYLVELNQGLKPEDEDKLRDPSFALEDGPVNLDGLSILSSDRKKLGIQIHSGKNRIVRRIFESLGYEIEKLDRTVYANLTKEGLPRGHWRFLTEKEVIRLKFLTPKPVLNRANTSD